MSFKTITVTDLHIQIIENVWNQWSLISDRGRQKQIYAAAASFPTKLMLTSWAVWKQSPDSSSFSKFILITRGESMKKRGKKTALFLYSSVEQVKSGVTNMVWKYIRLTLDCFLFLSFWLIFVLSLAILTSVWPLSLNPFWYFWIVCLYF